MFMSRIFVSGHLQVRRFEEDVEVAQQLLDVARRGKLEDHFEVFAAGHAVQRDGIGKVPLAQPNVSRELQEPLGIQAKGERQPLGPARLTATTSRELHERCHRVLMWRIGSMY